MGKEKKHPDPTWLNKHKWKKGQSGNSTGRATGNYSIKLKLQQELQKVADEIDPKTGVLTGRKRRIDRMLVEGWAFYARENPSEWRAIQQFLQMADDGIDVKSIRDEVSQRIFGKLLPIIQKYVPDELFEDFAAAVAELDLEPISKTYTRREVMTIPRAELHNLLITQNIAEKLPTRLSAKYRKGLVLELEAVGYEFTGD